MITVSYATKNTPYEKVLNERLLPTLKKFNLRYDIAYPEDFGSWQANTHIKAEIIKQMLLKHKEPIVFLDADATIECYPELFFKLQDYDMSYHSFDFDFYWKNKEGSSKREVLSGTLYFRYNEKVLQFIDEWIEENKKSTQWEQKNLQIVVERWKGKLKIYPLPLEYIAIVKGGDRVPNFIKNPVIVHHQASRRFRHYRRKK